MDRITWANNTMRTGGKDNLDIMSGENVATAKAFHQSFPQYAPTPLAELGGMAGELGLGRLFVKDESFRFGLNAFKVLGGSFAMAKYIASETGRDVADTTFEYLTGPELADSFGQATFFTATDGNHGRGVAWAANRLGQKSVVFMPRGSSRTRFDAIAAEGAAVTIEEVNYDDCVRIAASEAAKTDRGVVIQDTAWEGYEAIPAWIMQGYGTMAMEAEQQLRAAGVAVPTHVFVQAGVGSLAGAVQGYFANRYQDTPPVTVIMEARAADCLYRSVAAGDGRPHAVGGELNTVMAGLACGEANTLAWEILRNHGHVFVSCPDWVTERGMRMLAAPCRGDGQIVSGESGAVGMGLLASIMRGDDYRELRRAVGLNADSVVLMFSTEGDTDPGSYKRLVWGM